MKIACALKPHPTRRVSPDSAWPLRRADGSAWHRPAQVGRNPKGEDPQGEDPQGLRAQHEHAVGEADAPQTP